MGDVILGLKENVVLNKTLVKGNVFKFHIKVYSHRSKNNIKLDTHTIFIKRRICREERKKKRKKKA